MTLFEIKKELANGKIAYLPNWSDKVGIRWNTANLEFDLIMVEPDKNVLLARMFKLPAYEVYSNHWQLY